MILNIRPGLSKFHSESWRPDCGSCGCVYLAFVLDLLCACCLCSRTNNVAHWDRGWVVLKSVTVSVHLHDMNKTMQIHWEATMYGECKHETQVLVTTNFLSCLPDWHVHPTAQNTIWRGRCNRFASHRTTFVFCCFLCGIPVRHTTVWQSHAICYSMTHPWDSSL